MSRKHRQALIGIGTCDWGNCGSPAIEYRFDIEHGWLPVCRKHTLGAVLPLLIPKPPLQQEPSP